MKKPILVTGGAGYIGSMVCKTLAENNFLPICFDDLSRGHLSFVKWGPFVQGSLLDQKKLEEVFQYYKPVAVMHFAAKAYVIESILNPGSYYENNVTGSLNLLRVMRKEHVNKIVFSSTCATYGTPQTLPLVESHPQNPINPYGKTKKIVEQMILDFEKAHFFKSVILRYFNAAGADLKCEIGESHNPETHLIPLAIFAALGIHEKITIYGSQFPTKDGTAIRDYIHVQDLASAHIKALNYLLENNMSLTANLGSSKGYTVQEIIQKIEEKTQTKIPVEIAGKRPGEPSVLVANYEKAKKYLGWEPEYSDIDTIIDTALNWHKSKTNFCEKVSINTP